MRLLLYNISVMLGDLVLFVEIAIYFVFYHSVVCHVRLTCLSLSRPWRLRAAARLLACWSLVGLLQWYILPSTVSRLHWLTLLSACILSTPEITLSRFYFLWVYLCGIHSPCWKWWSLPLGLWYIYSQKTIEWCVEETGIFCRKVKLEVFRWFTEEVSCSDLK